MNQKKKTDESTMNKRLQSFFDNRMESFSPAMRTEAAAVLEMIEQERPRPEVMAGLLRCVEAATKADWSVLNELNDALRGDLHAETGGKKDPISVYHDFVDVLTQMLMIESDTGRGILLHAMQGSIGWTKKRRETMANMDNDVLRDTVLALDDMMIHMSQLIEKGWETLDKGANDLSKE